MPTNTDAEGVELDDVSSAPESGQVPEGREDPWDDETSSPEHPYPSPHHASPKDEL